MLSEDPGAAPTEVPNTRRICPSNSAGINECVTDDDLYWQYLADLQSAEKASA